MTTPAAPRSHGARPQRGLENVSSSLGVSGRFGRMFRNLPVFEQNEDDLLALADTMVQELEKPIDKKLGVKDDDENPEIPAGYTYLGQFIDHDITFDPVSSLQRQSDPDGLVDFRTPRFDLDSIYGRGPADQPYLYADGLRFVLGNKVSQAPERAGPDLPRNPFARAIIGDPRNDENLVVSQLHGLFLRFHNHVVDDVESRWSGPERQAGKDDIFKEAQRVVRWHYQWVVIHDFLPRILGGKLDGGQGAKIIEDILNLEHFKTGVDGKTGPMTVKTFRPRLLFYDLECPPFIPVEFSVAAYRFGHSMVRPSYFFNDFVREQIAGSRKDDEPFRTLIFSEDRRPESLSNLNGFRPLPPEWGFQWKFFFETADRTDGMPQPSYKIDATLVNPLSLLPDKVADNDPPFSLARRNLLRGRALGLPCGERVARAMGVEPLSPEELKVTQPSLIGNTPLWYYVLKEAELLCSAHHLGPVGARIVAETFIGLLWGDPLSYLRVEPTWTPDLASVGVFGMPELIAFTEDRAEHKG
ncbi:hypothetical protein TSA6c_17365 [Azospirillum sp. TSA6c]|nr:hypothetical protein TSA6c_17365 [Azospirillum sp. TSA6c]